MAGISHTQHKLIKKRLCTKYSNLSLPTDHCSPAYRLSPWPGHTVLTGLRQIFAPIRPRDRGNTSGPSLLYVLGHIDREDDYKYTPKVITELFGGKISLDPRLVRSLEVIPRPLRPLHHISGPRPLTPPAGPISINPSQVVLDAKALIDGSKDALLDRQKRLLKRVRQAPAVLPDLWPSASSEDCSANFKATCLGQPLSGPPLEVSTLLLSLENARNKIKNSSNKRIPKVLGSLSIDARQRNLNGKRARPDADHLVLASSSVSPLTSHSDIISLCNLRESLQKLKQKNKQRIK
ncbi:hypothetical protein LOD99_1139 [Oopsacas minuta]|uniref:Uncharacterized protein n=1 Tax=Oopsacas minuta TaxID=111878 RepID=A0AAV7K517_9METZ|nr:hypothetical protein LOD99_1139 [Oopsacas minuta]